MMHTKYRDTGKVGISAEQGLEIYTKFSCNSLVGQNPKAYQFQLLWMLTEHLEILEAKACSLRGSAG